MNIGTLLPLYLADNPQAHLTILTLVSSNIISLHRLYINFIISSEAVMCRWSKIMDLQTFTMVYIYNLQLSLWLADLFIFNLSSYHRWNKKQTTYLEIAHKPNLYIASILVREAAKILKHCVWTLPQMISNFTAFWTIYQHQLRS